MEKYIFYWWESHSKAVCLECNQVGWGEMKAVVHMLANNLIYGQDNNL